MISIDVTALVICLLVFGLVFVMKNFFFEPLAQAMEAREERIDTAAHAWDAAQESIQQAETSVRDAVQSVRNEGYQELDRARTDAQKTARDELDKNRDTVQEQIADARARLRDETDQAVTALESEAGALASQIAGRILGRDVA